MKLDSIDHFALSVADIDASINWYRTSFHCELVYQDATQAILAFENIKLVLVLPSQQQPHLALEKFDASGFGELRKHADGTESCFISDPSGNPVELIKPRVR
jgi:catechol 2,3-dioxygenase-like lactoylglutathione lyase family enzyme